MERGFEAIRECESGLHACVLKARFFSLFPSPLTFQFSRERMGVGLRSEYIQAQDWFAVAHRLRQLHRIRW